MHAISESIVNLIMILQENDRETVKNIIATVAYYDAMDFPLTAFEIWKYMMCAQYYDDSHEHQKTILTDVVRLLNHDALRQRVDSKNGFYFLKGREKLVNTRLRRMNISAEKVKKLRKVVNILRFVPFMRMVGVTGRVSMGSAQSKSDWDVLIVCKARKIWTGRTLATGVLHFLGKRRHGKKINDRVCLNYFITDGSLEVPTKDLFSAHEYNFILPLYDDNIYASFQLTNRWIAKMKPHYAVQELFPLPTLKPTKLSKFVQRIGEFLCASSFVENTLARLEYKKIMRNPKTKNTSGLIQASQEALIFLPDPKGPRIFEKFKQIIDNLSGTY